MMERNELQAVVWVIFLSLLITFAAMSIVGARDLDGRYGSTLKPWFDSLRSGKGPCCSDADGSALSDVDWKTVGGHYSVRIKGQWVSVPDDAVITEPNRAGVTMVWPMFFLGETTIRCFMPGSMS